ncbi:hypothetical protein C0993_001225 [Termitomyces sp. T159_Od127]|nr:hypothetical protein C0993_001225 [Termitomyces sp. T159_Od127]
MQQFNIVVLGAGGVGKSALTVRFIKDVFVENYDPTIEGTVVSTQILLWLTGKWQRSTGERSPSTGKYRRLTNEASLREVDNLRKQIYRIKGEDRDVPIVVVGTKLDLVSEREVQRTTISTLASRWALPFYETSAKKNWHITDVFEDLVKQMRQKYPQEITRPKKKPHCIIM